MSEDEEFPPDEMRNALDVARRCSVLIAVVATGHRQPIQPTVDWLVDEGLWDHVTPKERAFFLEHSPSQQQIVNATWRAEALHILLWSLNRLPSLCKVTEQCSLTAECDASPFLHPTSDFIASANLRPEEELRSALDVVYHAHWQVRDAQLRGLSAPDGLEAGAIYERHYALNWITGYCGQDWDHISTDT